MDFVDGLLIGTVIGLSIGATSVLALTRDRVLRKLPEEDMIREIKRRRFELALQNKTGQDVERELNGPPPNPRKD